MKENIQMLLTLCLFAYIIFLKQCEQGSSHFEQPMPRIDTIIRMDTTPPVPIVINLPRQEIPSPAIIYIDSSKKVVLSQDVDTTKHVAANLYQDSLEDDNLTLYYNSIIDGQLLQSNMSYKLKVPKFITKTVEITKPYPMPVSAFFLTGGIGGNVNQFSSVTVGAQFVSKKGWTAAYEYDVLQNTHHVKIGFKLFQLNPNKN